VDGGIVVKVVVKLQTKDCALSCAEDFFILSADFLISLVEHN